MRILIVLAIAIMAVSPLRAEPVSEQALVTAVATRFLVPAYQTLADAAAANEAAWRRFCSGPTEAALPALEDSHRALALAFGHVQAFRFGPFGEGTTPERIYFWPQRKAATQKGLAALLAGDEPITAGRVERASAAAQGIPALERLIFAAPGAGGAPAIVGETASAQRACAAGVAIAGIVRGLAEKVATQWRALADLLGQGRIDATLAPDAQQAASQIATDWLAALATIQDQKLEPVIGRKGEPGRISAAEARLSGLSTAMILANLAGVGEAFASLDGIVDPIEQRSWQAMIMSLADQARAMRDFPEGADDPEKRASQEAFLNRLKAVRGILQTQIPLTLGLKLGFNGLDGD
jgi:predicted lipoprotein